MTEFITFQNIFDGQKIYDCMAFVKILGQVRTLLTICTNINNNFVPYNNSIFV